MAIIIGDEDFQIVRSSNQFYPSLDFVNDKLSGKIKEVPKEVWDSYIERIRWTGNNILEEIKKL